MKPDGPGGYICVNADTGQYHSYAEIGCGFSNSVTDSLFTFNKLKQG